MKGAPERRDGRRGRRLVRARLCAAVCERRRASLGLCAADCVRPRVSSAAGRNNEPAAAHNNALGPLSHERVEWNPESWQPLESVSGPQPEIN